MRLCVMASTPGQCRGFLRSSGFASLQYPVAQGSPAAPVIIGSITFTYIRTQSGTEGDIRKYCVKNLSAMSGLPRLHCFSRHGSPGPLISCRVARDTHFVQDIGILLPFPFFLCPKAHMLASQCTLSAFFPVSSAAVWDIVPKRRNF